MYHLVYYIDGKRIEIIRYNISYRLCEWLQRKLSRTTHKMGEFKFEPVRLTL